MQQLDAYSYGATCIDDFLKEKNHLSSDFTDKISGKRKVIALTILLPNVDVVRTGWGYRATDRSGRVDMFGHTGWLQQLGHLVAGERVSIFNFSDDRYCLYMQYFPNPIDECRYDFTTRLSMAHKAPTKLAFQF